MKKTYEKLTKDELLAQTKIPLETVKTEDDIYRHMADDMYSRIVKNNAEGKNTVFIVPVGPIGQYEYLAKLCNDAKTDMKKVYFFNMDEYLDDDLQPIPLDHPLSFEGFMQTCFYDKLCKESEMPVENRIFPRPGKEGEIWELIQKLGGIEVAYGGIGINGHIAFNEPPEADEEMTDEAFAALATRVLKLTRETRTINSVTAANGYIDYIPQYCITIGMKEILSAREIRFYMNRTWQCGIVRKIAVGDVTKCVPASFFQKHADAKLIVASYVCEAPLSQLR